MVRPRKCRRVGAAPDVTYFKPRGVPLSNLNEIYLSVDGYEALRLADHQGLKHEDAAVQMGVSRQTFGRMLSKARRTVAQALVSGFALSIHGGDYEVDRSRTSQAATSSPGQRSSVVMSEDPLELSPLDERITCEKELSMDRIAVTSEGPDLDDDLDPRFGRAAGFIVVDPQTLDFEYMDNGASQTMTQGAGIQAAENVASSGAKAVLTGYVGPKAFKALDAVGIRVGQNLENMTVRQAVEAFVNGRVTWARQPNRHGHGQ